LSSFFETVLIKVSLFFRRCVLAASTLVWLLAVAATSCSAQSATATVLSVTPSRGASGSVFSLSASVTSAGGPATSGVVTFVDAYGGISEILGTIAVQGAKGTPGVAAVKRQFGGVGTHTITANFNATSGLKASSNSQTISLTPGVNAMSSGSTGTYLLTGTVSSFSPSLVPTGTFTFTDSSAGVPVLSGVPLDPSTLVLPTPANLYPTASMLYPVVGMKVGNSEAAPAFGDFNGDGKLDLVVPNNDGSKDGKSGLILLGNGDGTFTPGATLTSLDPSAAVVGDFNGDGKQDVAIVNTGNSGSVDVYLGNGDGSFQPMVKYAVATGSDYRIIAIGDFNRDGKQDLVITNHTQRQVIVLLGNGDGTFQTPIVSPPTGMAIGNLAIGDLNGDGIEDLVVADNGDNQVTVLIGVGDGTFTEGAYPTVPGNQSGTVALGDFNEDGKLDLIVTDQALQLIFLLPGNGDGTFQNAVTYATGSNFPYYVTTGDFNHDGHTDVLVTDNFGHNLQILLGDGKGNLGAATYYATGGTSYYAIVGDVNGDGLDDIVTSVDGGSVPPSGLAVTLSQIGVSTQPTSANVYGCGPQMITGTYSGDGNFGVATSSAINLNPTILATSLAVTANPSSSTLGQPVTLSAVLSPSQYGSYESDGETVIFMNGTTSLGSAPLKGGFATLNVTSLPIGAASITAVYAGDCTLADSSSGVASVTVVNAPLPDFNFQITSPSTVSGVYGGSGQFTFLLSPVGGTLYPGTVQFSVFPSPGPIAATYTFSPASVAMNGGPTNIVLTVSTRKLARLDSPFGYDGFGSIAVALFLLPLSSVRRLRGAGHRLARWMTIAIVLAASLAGFASLTGCGSGYFDRVYPIVVTATSGGVQHSITVNYHIEKSAQ
jgi:hypothetical protein